MNGNDIPEEGVCNVSEVSELGISSNYRQYRNRQLLLGTTHAFEKDNGRLTLIYYSVWKNSALLWVYFKGVLN